MTLILINVIIISDVIVALALGINTASYVAISDILSPGMYFQPSMYYICFRTCYLSECNDHILGLYSLDFSYTFHFIAEKI